MNVYQLEAGDRDLLQRLAAHSRNSQQDLLNYLQILSQIVDIRQLLLLISLNDRQILHDWLERTLASEEPYAWKEEDSYAVLEAIVNKEGFRAEIGSLANVALSFQQIDDDMRKIFDSDLLLGVYQDGNGGLTVNDSRSRIQLYPLSYTLTQRYVVPYIANNVALLAQIIVLKSRLTPAQRVDFLDVIQSHYPQEQNLW